MSRDPAPANTIPIADHAAIGDCRSVALVARDGTLDWLCWPGFSSAALFSGLLGPEGGYFRIGPPHPARGHRRYLPDTNVLETTFSSAEGRWRLTDFMPVAPADATLRPARALVRVVEGLDGAPSVAVRCRPRPGFGRRPHWRRRGALGWAFDLHGELVALHTRQAMDVKDGNLAADFTLRAGETRVFWLTHTTAEPAVVPALDAWCDSLDETVTFWTDWLGQCRYRGSHAAMVRRSLLTLKLLTYAPSGAVVAAATTSLPESLSGGRNWDYRFCWLRDSSLTFRVFNDTGFRREAEHYLRWLVLATRLSAPALQVVYDVYGRTRLTERNLPHLPGWRGLGPVRVGNDAHRQAQLDLYGKAVAAVTDFVQGGGTLTGQETVLLEGWARTVAAIWTQPDHGIWEVRTRPRHFTFSKAMAWLTFDAFARLLANRRPPHWEDRVHALHHTAERIRETIESQGVDPATGSYVAAFGETDVDSSLLLLPWFGFADARGPRMGATLKRILAELDHDGLLKRYRTSFDGFQSEEGAFVACGFWASDCLARAGRVDEAEQRFRHLLTFANDVGLLSEEIDIASGAQLGNTPQAFSHIALVNTAMTLEDARRRGDHAA